MKKLFYSFIVLPCLLTACGFESDSSDTSGSSNTSDTSDTTQDASSSNTAVFESDTSNPVQDESISNTTIDEAKNEIIPLYAQDTIKNNVASYSHSFKVTTSDKIYSYEIKFDYETSTGLARRQNFTLDQEEMSDPIDYFFIRDINNDCVIYSSNSEYFSHSFRKDDDHELFYLRLLFDISSEVMENAPYESKTELTYAGRQATKYVISDPDYVIPSDTKLNITLDNETGAVLSVTQDDLNWYESSEFIPNNDQAKNEVIAKKNTIPFEYFDTRILKIVNLENIVFPKGNSW